MTDCEAEEKRQQKLMGCLSATIIPEVMDCGSECIL